MISLYVNAILCTLQHIVIHAMQLSGVNSPNCTYWLEKVLKMISLYVNALLYTLQHIVIHAMQLSGVNWENWHRWSFSTPSLTSKYFACAFVQFPVQSPRPTPTLVYETAGRFFVRHPVELKYNNKFICFSQTQQYSIIVVNKLNNKILLCLTETNKYIVVFQLQTFNFINSFTISCTLENK